MTMKWESLVDAMNPGTPLTFNDSCTPSYIHEMRLIRLKLVINLVEPAACVAPGT